MVSRYALSFSISVKQKFLKKRRNPSSVEEVELQDHRRVFINVDDEELQEHDIYADGVELQRQQSDGNVENYVSHYPLTNRQQSIDSTESYLKPKTFARRLADTSSDDGYAHPYEDLPCFSEETELDVGTPFLGRRRVSLEKRPLPALPSRSRDRVHGRIPIPTRGVLTNRRSNDHLIPATNIYDSDTSESPEVTDTGYIDPDGPVSTPTYYNTPRKAGQVAPDQLCGETLDENTSNTIGEMYHWKPKGHQVLFLRMFF